MLAFNYGASFMTLADENLIKISAIDIASITTVVESGGANK